MKYLHLYVLPTESAQPLERADVTTIIGDFFGGVSRSEGGGSSVGGGSPSEGGGAGLDGPREAKGIFSTSHVCIRIYMYIYL